MRIVFFILIFIATLSPLSADWWDRFGPPVKLNFDQVIENPQAHLNLVVKFTVRFNQLGDYHPVGYTPFGEDHYINFSVWPLERKLWEKEDYVNDYKFLFMKKNHRELKTLMQLQRYDTITILGKLRSKFNNKAWFEIVYIGKERGFLTKKLISALILVHRQIEQRDYQNAIDTFRYLLDYNIPVDLRGYCLKMLGRIYYEIDDVIPAAYEFRKALRILRYDLELQKWYKECYKRIIQDGLREEYELYEGTPRRIRDDYPTSQTPLDREPSMKPKDSFEQYSVPSSSSSTTTHTYDASSSSSSNWDNSGNSSSSSSSSGSEGSSSSSTSSTGDDDDDWGTGNSGTDSSSTSSSGDDDDDTSSSSGDDDDDTSSSSGDDDDDTPKEGDDDDDTPKKEGDDDEW
jgi:tetratricopeptide (TPR) repeat protein